MGKFQGHGLQSIYVEIVLAVFWIFLFLVLRHFRLLPKIRRRMTLLDYLVVLIFVLFIPNSTYAFWEIKHLIFHYKVAVPPNLFSYLVFGSISLLGLITSVFGTRMIVNHYAKNQKERVIYFFFLSLICGFGAMVGQLNLNSWDLLNFSKITHAYVSLLGHPQLILVALISAFVIFSINILIDYFLKPF